MDQNNTPGGEPAHTNTIVDLGNVDGRGGKRKGMAVVEDQVVASDKANTEELATAISNSKLDALLAKCKLAATKVAGGSDDGL